MSLAPLADRFAAGFPEQRPAHRTVGRESEYPIVLPDGRAAEVAELWPLLARGGDMTMSYERGVVPIGLDGERYSFCAEVGRGTIELIVGPAEDLHGIAEAHAAGMARLLQACDEKGFVVLGYGIQPLTPATPAFMTPKQRYGVLLESIGQPWLWFTLTASDQVHAKVGRDEIVALTNLGNAMAPVTVALCANSPIYDGIDQGVVSSREARMGEIHAGTSRHGMPAAPDADLQGMMARLANQRLLMLREGEHNFIPPAGTLLDHLDRIGGTSAPDAWRDFLLHEHYIWNSARPRSAHGTIEMRSACQQPLHEGMAAAALGFSLIEAGAAIQRFLDAELGPDAWGALHAWHKQVVVHGLAAPEPTSGLLAGVLDRCAAALDARGRGEAIFLEPLFRRLENRKNPAQIVQAAFRDGGVPALVRLAGHTAWTDRPTI